MQLFLSFPFLCLTSIFLSVYLYTVIAPIVWTGRVEQRYRVVALLRKRKETIKARHLPRADLNARYNRTTYSGQQKERAG